MAVREDICLQTLEYMTASLHHNTHTGIHNQENQKNPKSSVFSKLLQKGYKKTIKEVPVVVQTKIKHLQYKEKITAKKQARTKNKNKTKQNFEPSTRYLCLGAVPL